MMRLLIYFRNLLLFTQGDTVKSILAWIAILLFVAILVVLLVADHQFIGCRLRVSLGLPTKRDKKEFIKENTVDGISEIVSAEEVLLRESLVSASGVESDSNTDAGDFNSSAEFDGTKVFEYSGENSASEDVFFAARVRKAVRIKKTPFAEACGECAEAVKNFLLSMGVLLVADEIASVSTEENTVVSEDFLTIPSAPDNSVEDFMSLEIQSLDLKEDKNLGSVGQVSENSFVDNFRSILRGAEDIVETLNSIRNTKNFNSYAFESLSDQVGDLYSKLRVMGGMLCDDQFVIASSDTVDSKQIQETVESIASSDFLGSRDSLDFSKNSERVNSYCDKPAERAVLSDLEVELLLGNSSSGENFTNFISEPVLPAEEVISEPVLSVEDSDSEPVLSSDSIEDLLAFDTRKEENDLVMEKSIAWLESMIEESSLVLPAKDSSVSIEEPLPVAEDSPVSVEEPLSVAETSPTPVEESLPVEEFNSEPVQEPEVAPEPSALDLCMDRHKGFVPVVGSEDFSFTCKLDGAFVLSNEDGKLYFSNTFVRVNNVPTQWTNREIAFHKNDVLDVDTGIITKLSENLKYSYAVDKEELLQVHGLKITDFYFDEQDSLHAEFFALKDNVVSFEDELIILKVK